MSERSASLNRYYHLGQNPVPLPSHIPTFSFYKNCKWGSKSTELVQAIIYPLKAEYGRGIWEEGKEDCQTNSDK